MPFDQKSLYLFYEGSNRKEGVNAHNKTTGNGTAFGASRLGGGSINPLVKQLILIVAPLAAAPCMPSM